jgi:hypothetical protein
MEEKADGSGSNQVAGILGGRMSANTAPKILAAPKKLRSKSHGKIRVWVKSRMFSALLIVPNPKQNSRKNIRVGLLAGKMGSFDSPVQMTGAWLNP